MAFGYGTVVLQAGEDYALSREWVAEVVRRIKRETPLAVTLSLGERDRSRTGRHGGARARTVTCCALKPRTRSLFELIHPGRDARRQAAFLPSPAQDSSAYEAGSGIMVGLPGQTYESVARDIGLFRELDLDMIGIGPFIPHPQTPLGNGEL